MGIKLARKNLRKGFHVQDVLLAQVKTFMLGKKDWKMKNTALGLLLNLMFCKSFAAFCFFSQHITLYVFSAQEWNVLVY